MPKTPFTIVLYQCCMEMVGFPQGLRPLFIYTNFLFSFNFPTIAMLFFTMYYVRLFLNGLRLQCVQGESNNLKLGN